MTDNEKGEGELEYQCESWCKSEVSVGVRVGR